MGENPVELPQDHVQNHEPLDAVPVNPVDEPSRANLSYSDPASVVDGVANVSSGGNAVSNVVSDTVSNPISDAVGNATSSSQPTNPLIEEIRPLEPFENARVIMVPGLPYSYGSNFIRRLESSPVYETRRMRVPKNLDTARVYRSLPIDMTSMAGLYTAAAAQSGHTSENRRELFARFLDENLN